MDFTIIASLCFQTFALLSLFFSNEIFDPLKSLIRISNPLYVPQALHTEVERLRLAVEPLEKLIDEVAAANADSDTLRSELNSLQKRLRLMGAALDSFISGLNERERKIEVPLYYVIISTCSYWCFLVST